jgi:hypothetical protein
VDIAQPPEVLLPPWAEDIFFIVTQYFRSSGEIIVRTTPPIYADKRDNTRGAVKKGFDFLAK